MSLCNGRELLPLTRKRPEGAAVAALRGSDAASYKKRRATRRRINQCFLIMKDKK